MGLYGGGGGSAPKPDPRIGEAAVLSARTGQQALAFMRSQARITNRWAAQDRDFYMTNTRPLEQRFMQEAAGWDTQARRDQAGSDARVAVARGASLAQGQAERQLTAMGVSPGSGRFAVAAGGGALQTQLASVGAENAAANNIRAQGDAKEAAAIAMGKGLEVNPGTSMGLSNGAAQSGYGAAMQGYGQQGQLLNNQYQSQLQAHQINREQSNSMWGGIGSLIGAGLSFLPGLSDENAKTDRKPLRGAVAKVQASPAEEYRYKEGQGDGGAEQRVGPMAQDLHAATGEGTPTTVPMPQLIGLHHGAIEELGHRVDALEAKKTRGAKRPGGEVKKAKAAAPRGARPKPEQVAA